MQRALFLLIYLPVLAGIAGLFLKREGLCKKLVSLVFSIALLSSVIFFIKPPERFSISLIGDYQLFLGVNNLSKFILIFVNLFGLLVCLYSLDSLELKVKRIYFSYLCWLIAASNLVCLSTDFIILIFSWGTTLALLYAMLNLGSGSGANKALSIVGFGDFSFILGACLYVFSAGTTVMPQGAGIALNSPLAWSSFLLMLVGAFAKAGCGPLHTWIPTAAESAPLAVMAILPASLDKLLGIYLLARVCVDFFVLNNLAHGLLLLTGSLTIIFAVILALIQHDLRKLLSYHAISQVGYMVLGFGTGVPVGIAGGLFHMVNNAIYKSGLFLTGASVGEKKGTFELEKLGGLAAYMPVTFVSGLVFSLSISGVPPFNGFVSKWMLYQGVITGLSLATGKIMALVCVFSLAAAMFGSVLTLASFMKFIHAIFLGEDKGRGKERVSEVSANMKFSVSVLAALCILLGVLPNIFLRNFIEPFLSQKVSFIGTWNSLLAFIWVLFGLFLGFAFYKLAGHKQPRQDNLFIGGEDPGFGPNFPATEFYRSIEELPLAKGLYRIIRFEAADLYNVLDATLKFFSYILFIFVDRLINLLTLLSGSIVLGLSWIFRKLHSGVLDLYLVWSLAGLIVICFILMGR